MKLLLTGYPGFLAESIKKYFEQQNWHVDTLGLQEIPAGEFLRTGVHIRCNLVERPLALPKKNDLVIHAAGKAHVVPRTNAEKKSFYDVNVIGTKNLLSALQQEPP